MHEGGGGAIYVYVWYFVELAMCFYDTRIGKRWAFEKHDSELNRIS